MITTFFKQEALELAFTLAGFELLQAGHAPELHKDEDATRRAGYPVYRGEAFTPWVSDLGDRFEVNGATRTKNIWYSEREFHNKCGW